MSDKKRIYVFVNSRAMVDWLNVVAICEDGKVLAGHVCSNEYFIPHDMGLIDGGWKRDKYDEHCGKGGWSVEYVADADIEGHAELQKAFELNKTQGPPDSDAMPRVEVTLDDGSVAKTKTVGLS